MGQIMNKKQENMIVQYTKDYYKYSLMDDGFTIERYVDYRDEFPESVIAKVLNSSSPRDTYFELVDEMDIQCDDWCYEDNFKNGLRTFCENNGIDSDEAEQFVYDNFRWCYPEDFLNPSFRAVIQIDCGDGNYDFSLHNVLNYARNDGYCKGLEKAAGLHWLAKQQGRLALLNKAIRDIKKDDDYSKAYSSESRFVSSSVKELENLISPLGSLNFLVEMHLHDAIDILQSVHNHINNKDFNEYHPLDVKGVPFGYITLSKETVCGLYDSCNGGGSLMEIELEKDVKIPIQFVNSIETNDNIQNVYDMVYDCWKDTLKTVKIA